MDFLEPLVFNAPSLATRASNAWGDCHTKEHLLLACVELIQRGSPTDAYVSSLAEMVATNKRTYSLLLFKHPEKCGCLDSNWGLILARIRDT